MKKQCSPAKSRYGWRWSLIAIGGLAWLSVGCNPQTISWLVLPFTDTNVQPEYKLFAADKELTVALLSNFARAEVHPELQPADAELADLLGHALRKRCQDNKHKIKIIPGAQVRSAYLNQQLPGGIVSPVELGKSLKADYVLEMAINSFSIYAKDHHPPMYRGDSDLAVNLYKVEGKDGEHKVFSKDFRRTYPGGSGPIDASNMSATQFRSRFLAVMASDISKLFIAYPPEERRILE